MPDPKIHTLRRNWIEEILRHIPGFRGYLEKEYRRDSDQLQRDWLAGRLQRSKKALDDLSRSMVDAGQIDALPEIDRVRARIDKLSARIAGAMRGYSGFFDLVHVDATLLDHVYQLDLDMVTDVELLAKQIENVPNQRDRLADVLSEALQQIDAVEQKFARREELLGGLAQ